MIKYSEASVMELRSRGVLDTPHARGTTASCRAALSPSADAASRADPLARNSGLKIAGAPGCLKREIRIRVAPRRACATPVIPPGARPETELPVVVGDPGFIARRAVIPRLLTIPARICYGSLAPNL